MPIEKFENERKILNLAIPLLREIYGEFEIDNDQEDNPDAAILLNGSSRVIGIEITSVDPAEVKSYFNDEKITAAEKQNQIECLMANGSFTKQPMKKMSIPFKNDYIFNGITNKREKIKSYMNAGNYSEMIVVASSEYLEISDEYFFDYHMPWANYLLSDSLFPFDKVLYVCEKAEKAVLIYDKSNPLAVSPKRDENIELGITCSLSSIIPFGQSFNHKEMFDKDPIISPKSRCKKEVKKQKAQRAARKINRKK